MDIIDNLRAADPAAGIPDGPLDPRAHNDLHRATAGPAPRRSRARPRLVLSGAAVAALGVVAAAGLPTIGGEPATSPAFALERKSDDTVTVKFFRWEDPDGLEAAIEKHGINAEIDYLPAGKVCRQPRYTAARDQSGLQAINGGADGASLTLRPSAFHPGNTLVIEHAAKGQPTDGAASFSPTVFIIAQGPVAPCDTVDGPQPVPTRR